jgi:CelD/BcsL family acetyltransferase involved in cellulose biosynthesis
VLSVEPVRRTADAAGGSFSPQARMARAGDMPLVAEVSADLAAVEGAWRRLEWTGVCSPYQRFDWIASYAATMCVGQGAATHVLTIHRKGGEPLLLLALALEVRGGLRIAAPVGGKQANYHVPVMARGAGAALAPEIMQKVLREAATRLGVDVFAFRNLPLVWDDEPNPLVLSGATPSPSSVPTTALPRNADLLLGKAGTSEARRKLRRKEASLAALGDLAYRVARTREDVDGILEAFFRQKNERFRELGIASPYTEEAARGFIRVACLAGLDHGRPAVELHGLSLDGRVIAVYGGAVDARRFSCMFNSFDQAPEIARFSPGDILLTRLIRTQCSLGRTALDLGIGEARYKRLFCKEAEDLVDVFFPVTMKGRLCAAALKRLVAAKRYVKQTPWLWSLAQALRTGRSKLGLA